METNNLEDMAAEKEKILTYLESQLNLKIDALHGMESPIDLEGIKDLRKLEELILKREIYDLRRHIQVIKMM